MTAVPVSETTAEQTARATGSALFGRGMLYVVIWSLQMVASVVVSPVLAHTLGPATFGSLASAIAIYQLLIILAVCGLDQALQVERAAAQDSRSARGLVAAGITLAFLVAVVGAATAGWWGGWAGFPPGDQLVRIALLWTAPGGSVLVVLALLQSEDKLRRFALVSAISSVGGQVLGLGAMWWFGRSAEVYALGGVVSQTAALVVGIVLVRPRFRGLADLPLLRRAFRLGLPLMLTGLSIFVLNVSDRLVMQRLLGSAEVGRFQVAYTLGYVLILVLSFTNRAWIPRMAEILDDAERWAVVRQSRDGTLRLVMPAVLGITLAAPILLRIVAPPSFRPEGLLVVVFLVAAAAFPVTAVGSASRMLITLRRGRPLVWAAAAAVVVKLGMNFVLVPTLGIAGAAVATLVALTAQAVIQNRALPAGLVSERPPWRLIAACAAVCGLAAASCLLPQGLVWNCGRFAAGLLCLPWLWTALSRLRRGTPAPVTRVAPSDISAPGTPARTS